MNPFFFQSARYINNTLPLYLFKTKQYSPNRLFLEIFGIAGFQNYELQISTDENFAENQTESHSLTGVTTYEEIADSDPFGTVIYARFRGVAAQNSNWSEVVELTPADVIQVELPTLLTATADNEQVTVTYENQEFGIGFYVWQYKLQSASEWTTHGTIDAETQGGEPYVFTGLTNNEDYDFRASVLAENFDFQGGNSNVLSATPQAANNQLATPTIVSVTQPDNSTLLVTFTNEENAENYISNFRGVDSASTALDGGSQTQITLSISAADFGNSMPISIVLVDTDATYTNSDAATTNYTPYDVENTTELFLEHDYFKPLDGRLHDGITAPLTTITPFANMDTSDKNYLSTNGFSGTDYSKVTASQANIFEATDEGKKFVAFFNHMNPLADPQRADEFPPNEISARYATVVKYVDDENIFVDFEYNGGESTPITNSGVMAQIMDDAKTKWETFISNLQADNTTIGKLHSYGWVSGTPRMKVYNWFNASAINITNALKTVTTTASKPAMVRYGVEGAYMTAHESQASGLIYNKPSYLFGVGGTGTNNVILNNIIFAPPIAPHKTARTYGAAIFGGSGKTAGICLAHGNNSRIEKQEIEAGHGVELLDIQPISKFTNHSSGGTYSGTGLLEDADQKLFFIETHGYHEGNNCLVQSGGNGNAVTIGIYNGKYFHDTPKNDAIAPLYKVRATNDPTGLPQPIIDRINAGVYRGQLLEVLGGNPLVYRQMGGNNRYNWLRVLKYLLHLPNQGDINADLSAYLDTYYNNGYAKLANPNDYSTSFINKILLLVGIPRANKSYTVGRDYEVTHKNSPIKFNGTGIQNSYNAIQGNAKKTKAFWCDVTNEVGNFTVGEKVTYSGDGREFILHEHYNGDIDLFDPVTDDARAALQVGETLTGVTSGATAEITDYHPRRHTIGRIKQSKLHTECFRNCIQWGVIHNKYGEDFGVEVNPDIPENSYPQGWQPGCKYTIPHYLLLKDVSELAVGDTITNGTVSGVITNIHLTYDQYEMGENILDEQIDNRVKKWYCRIDANTTSFAANDNVNNGNGGTATVDRVSSHDENLEYSIKSMMGLIFPSNTGEVPTSKTNGGFANNGGGYGMYYILDNELPTELPMTYEVDCTYSNIENDLLDGELHATRQGYKSTGRVSSHLQEGTTTNYYRYTWPTYHGWLENAQPDDGNFKLILGEITSAYPENITYVKGNNNYDFRWCTLKGEFRENMAPFPAATTINLVGGGTRNVFPLYFYAKHHTLVNVDCSDLGGTLSGSPEAKGHYFDEARMLVDYLINEGDLPAYTEADYSKLRVYGDEQYDYGQRHSAQNYVRDLDANNAPPIPAEIQGMLTAENITVGE